MGKLIVFFTGDLTQSGKKEEFDELAAFLNELWSHFNKLNSNPYLIAIPGNHDLNRPDQTRAAVKVLRNYHSDDELQADLWNELAKKGEYYDVINKCFENFCTWYKGSSLPKPDLKYGLIPGDISAQLSINNINLKIVGLNTAFLELTNGDYVGKLAIHPLQLISLTTKDPLMWAGEADISLLLTHHDPTWYDRTSLEYYNNDINPADTFYSHLCGHLHSANTVQYGLLGSSLRRTQLAPSLFGLQKINNELDRIHGYYAGSYIFQDNSINEIFYPRKANKRYDGNYGIDSDTGYNLSKAGFLELNRPLDKNNGALQEDTILLIQDKQLTEKSNEVNDKLAEENILDLKKTFNSDKELDKVPKVSYPKLPQHSNIRVVEQENFLNLLQKDRIGWLITDWGLNENGFIGSISDQLSVDSNKGNFIINCEDIATDAELLSAVEEQFSMSLQRFCNLASTLNNKLLIFDHANVNLYLTISAFNRFCEILKSILDYCPKIYIIVIARQLPTFLSNDQFIKLLPLDAGQIKSYVEHHPGSTRELDDHDNLLKLIDITSGLPKHIDRFIESLRVASFEELIEAERESPPEVNLSDQIPKSLKQAIGLLVDTTDRLKLRSFKLLKILTVLANGETFSNMSRFDSTEPIYLDNANELERLSLLDVIVTTKALTKVDGDVTHQIKIMRVPRQIRDYVNTLITENEKENIIKLACDMYFGSRWREGNIRGIYGKSLLGPNKFFNADNCHLVISNLMASAFKNNNEVGIERASLVAINFCDHVFHVGDYKNAIYTAEEIYNWLKPTDHFRSKATIAKILGEALRMTNSHDKSNLFLNEALNMQGAQLSNDEKNGIYIDLGYTYLKQSKYDKAIECAKAIERTATPKGAHSIQAKYIFAEATLEGDAFVKRLKSLETEAKRANIPELVNTISLHIVDLNNDLKEREKRLNNVLVSKGDDYNKIRAILKKSTDILNHEDMSLSQEDLHLLNISYSYLYTQRLKSMFTSCHKALWLYCIKEQRHHDLLNLFKHSSLVWRISGENALEKSYFENLKSIIDFSSFQSNKDDLTIANIDYYNRRNLEFNSQHLLISLIAQKTD